MCGAGVVLFDGMLPVQHDLAQHLTIDYFGYAVQPKIWSDLKPLFVFGLPLSFFPAAYDGYLQSALLLVPLSLMTEAFALMGFIKIKILAQAFASSSLVLINILVPHDLQVAEKSVEKAP